MLTCHWGLPIDVTEAKRGAGLGTVKVAASRKAVARPPPTVRVWPSKGTSASHSSDAPQWPEEDYEIGKADVLQVMLVRLSVLKMMVP